MVPFVLLYNDSYNYEEELKWIMNYRNDKNINQMGIVCMFKESDIFCTIGGIELQRWVQHFPLHRVARTYTSSFSFDDLVT